MSIATTKPTVADYVNKIATANPAEAVAIALAEAERQQALAAKAAEEYRALCEVEFDDKGRIARATMGGLWRLAQMYSGSQMVPEQYRNKPHDCFIACQMAARLRVDPFAYMQASYVVHGRPGLEAKLAIAMLNTSGKIKGRVGYRAEGADKTRCYVAFAVDAETGEVVESPPIDWKMVVGEGWNKNSKWTSMPEVMFRYRSATFLIRTHYPEVLMGMSLVDELEDEGPARVASKSPQNLSDLTEKLLGSPPPQEAEEGEFTPKSESTEKAEGTSEENSEASESTDPPADITAVLSDLAAELATCKDLAAVQAAEDFYLPKVPADKSIEVHGPCDERRDAIRASRGSKSNQKSLAGAT